ncbi:fibrinogen C domain-containing protein 1-like isoform X2 [Sabethes cyaneus]|uniref:fibrinogen C domain-containing protein 1-like isoform X2 n=1 Tax=Sabethes cyaneus TaxID=53552 RepID=UPI00237D4827|nr:fibrinogen C domain-containing protein 1-like isoform X2 [Sabethes cyaneus]
MEVKLMLLSVLVPIGTIVNDPTAKSNENISTPSFQFNPIVGQLDAVISNRTQSNFRPQGFTSNVESLRRAAERIETLVAKQVQHVSALEKQITKFLLPEARNWPQTCAEISDRRSGLYRIQPQTGFSDAFDVYCEQQYEGGGWTVIQNRYDGSINFFRGWKEYEDGFGDLRGEFWLGLKKIHELTYVKRHELHVVLEDFNGTIVTAQYDRFIVDGSETKYVLNSLGNYTGTAGNSLSGNLGIKFTTVDNDNDWWSGGSCAQYNKGCWWYNNCGNSNLNGLYREGSKQSTLHVMFWYSFPGSTNGLKRSRMMIRPAKNI